MRATIPEVLCSFDLITASSIMHSASECLNVSRDSKWNHDKVKGMLIPTGEVYQ